MLDSGIEPGTFIYDTQIDRGAWLEFLEELTDRKEGKGRRCCLGYTIHSIPCHTTDLAPG